MKRNASKLTVEQKAFVVQRLAQWDTPAEAAAALKAEFGVALTPQGCEAYDPGKRAARKLAKKWRDLFAVTRANFLKDLESHVPESNKAVRVRHLALASRVMRQRGNYHGMKEMFEAIAKELGNVHTNRREVTGKDGKAIEMNYTDMTPEQVQQELRAALGKFGIDPEDMGIRTTDEPASSSDAVH